MTHAHIAVEVGNPRAQVNLVGAAVVPRLVSRTDTAAHVALVAGGALLLPGDHVQISITVGAGASLHLEDVGGTVCYGEADGGGDLSRWTAEVDVAAGGHLHWAGLPLVVAAGARIHRRTAVQLDPSATVVMRETSVLGRVGESGGSLRAEFIAHDQLPVLVEDLRVRGDRPEPGVLGGHRVYDAVTALGFRPSPIPGTDLMHLDRPGAVARFLGAEAHLSPLADTAAQWSREAGTRLPGPVLPPAQAGGSTS